MASNLFNFLADMAKHAQKFQDFKNDPESVMDQYNLTQEQKDHILSLKDDNKQHDIHKIMGEELHDHFTDGDFVVC